MTNYVILKKHTTSEPVTTESRPRDLWSELTAQVASSPKAAIRQVISKTNESGVYIAVPARSWVKQTAEIEQKTAVKFS